MKSDPRAFTKNTILVHESPVHSMDPRDTGNWVGNVLVGSKYGITGPALAKHRKVKPEAITAAMMSKLTEAEAIEVVLTGYYHTNGIDLLPWDVVLAGVTDLSVNAGPSRAVKILQALIGVAADGAAGKKTRDAYAKWRCLWTDEDAMRQWTKARIAFYRSLDNKTYINGWINRANSFLPGTRWWGANA